MSYNRKTAVPIGQAANAISEVLTEYSNEVAMCSDECVDYVAGKCVEKLKKTSPRRKVEGRHYADGWFADTVYGKLGNKRVLVRNKFYQLTHLLENGHAKKGGKGRTKAIPHIKPVEEWAQEELPKQFKERVKK